MCEVVGGVGHVGGGPGTFGYRPRCRPMERVVIVSGPQNVFGSRDDRADAGNRTLGTPHLVVHLFGHPRVAALL